MSSIPVDRYPGLPPLFLDFARGESPLYPDPPTMDAALARGRALLESRRTTPLPARAFRFRGASGRKAAEDLAAGRAVPVLAGHQVGLFTGPLYTLGKAFDAIAIARELTRRGVPAVPVFWALTDDHDLEEVARTARPGPDGPERFVLEGADRSNRAPVGERTDPGRSHRDRGGVPREREERRSPRDRRRVREPVRARADLRRGIHRNAARPDRRRGADPRARPARRRGDRSRPRPFREGKGKADRACRGPAARGGRRVEDGPRAGGPFQAGPLSLLR